MTIVPVFCYMFVKINSIVIVFIALGIAMEILFLRHEKKIVMESPTLVVTPKLINLILSCC